MDLSEVGALLDPKPVPLETGYERLPSGALHVAVRTDMHGCSGEMLEWWFRWRCDTQKYVWWHPIDHVSSHWQGELSPDTHIGSEHVVSEFFSGLPAADLIVQVREPSEFFDADAYAKAEYWAGDCCTLHATPSGVWRCAVTSTWVRTFPTSASPRKRSRHSCPMSSGRACCSTPTTNSPICRGFSPRCLSPNTAIRGRRERRGERLCHRCAPLDMPSRVPGPER